MTEASEKPLFEVHEKNLNTGLRGFPVGTVRTSFVDAEAGVHYVGYPIDQLNHLPAERIVYLLLNKQFPTEEEEKAFRGELARRSKVPEDVIAAIKLLPKQSHPMDWFISAIGYLGHWANNQATEDFREDGLNLIARTSEVIAAIFRIRSGWGEPIPSEPERGIVGNFIHMLGNPNASEHIERVLREFFILHMDHGGGNLSTFVGKAVASGLADIYLAMQSAMAALAGPLHGRANQEALAFVRTLDSDDEDEVRKNIQQRLAVGKVVPGYGHAVLRAEDPRSKVLFELGEATCPDDKLFRICKTLRKVVPEVLKQHPKIKNPYPNVDASTGSILMAAGLLEPEYYTVLFGWSRVVGITAQIIDERYVMRGGKGVPIYRPRFIAEDQPARGPSGRYESRALR